MTESQGLVSMSKRFFWKFFRAAWDGAFTEENITQAFAATGIWPFDPQRVIQKVRRVQTPPLESPAASKTPRSTKAVRRLYKKLKKEGHIDEERGELLFVAKKLAAYNEILRFENEGFRNAIVNEKKKRKRGKAMKFHEKGEVAGQVLFFSLAKIGRFRDRQVALEEAEAQK